MTTILNAMQRQVINDYNLYRDIVESQNELICRFLRQNMTVTFVNMACSRHLNSQPERLLGQDFNIFLLEEERNIVKQKLESLSIENSKVTHVAKTIEANGSMSWCEWNLQAVFDRDGNFITYQAVGRDVTERQQLEDALQQRQAQYRTIFETVSDGIFIHDFDTGKIVEANPAACEMHNCSYEDMLRRTPLEYIHKDSHRTFVKFLTTSKNQGKFFGEAVGVRKDGSSFDVEVKGATIIYNGKPHALSAVRDISHSKGLEKALQSSQAKLTDILSTTQASIVSFRVFANYDWEYTYQSPGCEALFGYTAKQILEDKHFWMSKVFSEDVEQRIMPLFEKFFIEGDVTVEYRFCHKDGSIRWISGTYTSRHDEIADCWDITGVSFDITERKIIETTREMVNQELEARVKQRTKELATSVEKLNREIEKKIQVETALRNSEAKFRRLFDANLVGVMFASINGEIYDANDYFLDMLGYTKEEVKSGQLRWTDITPPECASTDEYIMQQLSSFGYSIPIEKIYLHKSGTPIPILIAVALLEDNSEDTGIAVTVDISQQKGILQELQQAKTALQKQIELERLQSAITQRIHESLDLGTILNNLVTQLQELIKVDRVIVYRILDGYNDAPIAEAVFPNLNSIFDVPAFSSSSLRQKIYQRCLQETFYAVSNCNEVDNIGNDLLEQLQNLQVRSKLAVPIIQEGKLWGLLSVHQCNESREWQSYEIKFIQELASQLAIGIRQCELYQQLQVELRERTNAEAELKKLNQDLAEKNLELAYATRLKDEFLANMSHELRTPLNAILGLSEGLLDEVYARLNYKQKHAVSTIHNSGKHLLELINDILDLAKIESGRIRLEMSPVRVNHLCDFSCTFIKLQAKKKNIQLITKIPPHLKTINIDELRMRQVLINLLSNAVKFTPNNGNVQLSVDVDTQENTISFHVSDTGIGIDAKNIDKLFQPFVQVDSSLSRSYSGTGLGLALVRKIIEMHRGSISVSSELGKGSCFTITMQYQNNLVQETHEDKLNISLQSYDEKQRLDIIVTGAVNQPLILLAEDNPTNTELVTEFLGYCGYRFVIARNGLDAIQLAKTEKPSLIIMDIQMPQMDGFAAIHAIRAEPQLTQVPIIALTALAMSGDKERCLEAGANEYLSKPVSLKYLANLIKKILGG